MEEEKAANDDQSPAPSNVGSGERATHDNRTTGQEFAGGAEEGEEAKIAGRDGQRTFELTFDKAPLGIGIAEKETAKIAGTPSLFVVTKVRQDLADQIAVGDTIVAVNGNFSAAELITLVQANAFPIRVTFQRQTDNSAAGAVATKPASTTSLAGMPAEHGGGADAGEEDSSSAIGQLRMILGDGGGNIGSDAWEAHLRRLLEDAGGSVEDAVAMHFSVGVGGGEESGGSGSGCSSGGGGGDGRNDATTAGGAGAADESSRTE